MAESSRGFEHAAGRIRRATVRIANVGGITRRHADNVREDELLTQVLKMQGVILTLEQQVLKMLWSLPGEACTLSPLHGRLRVNSRCFQLLLTASVAGTFLLTCDPAAGAPLFQAGYYSRSITTDPAPLMSTMTLADVDADGHADAVFDYGNSIFKMSGNGDGTLRPLQTCASAGRETKSILVTDLNHDGRVDLVLSSRIDSVVSVCLGLGAGAYGVPSIVTTHGACPSVGDLDGDGTPDLVIARDQAAAADWVEIWRGIGNGTFACIGAARVRVSPSVTLIRDLNGDGKRDLVVGHVGTPESGGILSVLLGNGDGTVAPRTDFSIAGEFRAIETADMNSDGKLDIVAGTSSKVAVLLNQGTGGFSIYQQAPLSVRSMAIGSVNADSHPDVILGAGVVRFLPGTASGWLLDSGIVPAGEATILIGLADMNEDGRLDAVAFNSGSRTVTVHPGTPGGPYGSMQYSPVPSSVDPRILASADFDGNRVPDLLAVMSNYSSDSVLCYLATGVGSYRTAGAVYLMNNRVVTGSLTDYNQDGTADAYLVTRPFCNQPYCVPRRGHLVTLRGDLDGTLVPISTIELGYNSTGIAVGDFNEDGFPDAAVSNTHDFEGVGILSILRGGSSGPSQPTDYEVLPNPEFIAASDLDHDGHLDLLAIMGSSAALLQGRGDGTFLPASYHALPPNSGSPFAYSDFTGDGVCDLVSKRSSDNMLFVIPGSGSAFGVPIDSVAVGEHYSDGQVADVNNDGELDVVIKSYFVVKVYLGTGDGHLVPENEYGPQPLSFGIVDVDGDGRSDIVTTNQINRPSRFGTFMNVGNLPLHVPDEKEPVSGSIALYPPKPHPVVGALRISLALARGNDVDLGLFDVGGRRVMRMRLSLPAGLHSIELADRASLPSGVYFVRAEAGRRTSNLRVCVIR